MNEFIYHSGPYSMNHSCLVVIIDGKNAVVGDKQKRLLNTQKPHFSAYYTDSQCGPDGTRTRDLLRDRQAF
jgi:hypothetical protein